MNFQALKWLIDNLIEGFKCPDCNEKSSSEYVEIIWAAGTNINLEIMCPKCNKISSLRTQMQTITIPIDTIISDENLKIQEMDIMKDKLSKIEHFNENSIKDSQIISLNKNLKSTNFSMEALFNNK